ncbi:nitrate- and nitrite sensing domain-containing protein [Kitasatospora sp. NPDC097643]|uniref:sensor histidine kinase n=1 Tax=Kitasatospora sp. NPDC097643 TaxID=3157230 RepID=UPI003316E1C5
MREDRGTAPGARRGAHAGPPARPPRPGPRLRGLRPRSVRARIVALLMVPVVSVLALWGFATVTTAQDVWDLIRVRDAQRTLLTPVAATVSGLQAERAAAGELLATPGVTSGAAPGAPGAARESALREAATATDRAFVPLFPDPLHPGQGYNRADAQGLGPDAAARLDALGAALGALPDLRARVLARGVGWPEAYAAYGIAVDRALAVVGALTPLQDHRAGADARVLLEFARSRELLAREDALLRSAQLSGALTDEQLREFAGSAFARRQFEQGFAADLPADDRAALLAVVNGQDHRDLTGYEDRLRAAADGRAAVAAVPPDRWALAAGNVARDLRAVEDRAGRIASEAQDPYALGLFTPAGIAVLLGLVGVVASLVISVQIGRGLVSELIGLRNSALELAGRKLPATIRRLRAGEEVDIEAEAPRPVEGADEIGQVHRALGTVQRAAVTAAVERAEVLSGVSGVFVNLARRSQVLVHRQLTLLDAMERRTEDPSELADLFRLDHLTTRMRRHAEGLIILSGAAPGRAWRRPVPLLDVVRAAVSEVEEYARIEVHPLPRVAVTGQAVADLTHLVAELVENATGFSPPHTRVHIRGEQVGNGFALEIEDRGLGMGPAALAAANRRIAAAEQTDLFDSDRLGLFVVSRLARRQGVRVSLVPSAYGGTTAVVLLPTALLADRAGAAAGTAVDPAVAGQDYEPVPELDVMPEGGAADEEEPAGRGTSLAPSRAPWPEPWPEPTFTLADGLPDEAPAAEEGSEYGGEEDEDDRLPAAGGPPPEGGALLPFGVRGGDPGTLRRTPFRASGARVGGPAADGGPGAAFRPQPGPPQSTTTRPYRPAPRSVPRPNPASDLTSDPASEPTPGPSVVGTPVPSYPSYPSYPSHPSRPATGRQPGGDVEELPRRVRQASLVPQLREAPARPEPRTRRSTPGTVPGGGRSPEAARAAMSAFQAGWARGALPDRDRPDPALPDPAFPDPARPETTRPAPDGPGRPVGPVDPAGPGRPAGPNDGPNDSPGGPTERRFHHPLSPHRPEGERP